MDGELHRIGDRWELRFTRHLAHAREKVWRALIEPEHLDAWFPARIEGERAAGAKLRFAFREDEGPTIDGEMVAYDPPSRLELRWGDDTLRFELEADGDGTVLTFVNTFDEIGRAARDAAGWHACLDLLGYHLASQDPPWAPEARWAQVHPGYVARFPAEAASLGPPTTGSS